MPSVWLIGTGVATVLNICLVFLLARGPIRRFPLVFLFCSFQILITAADSFVSYRDGAHSEAYSRCYWTGDLLAHLIIVLLVVFLIRDALPEPQLRGWVTSGLITAMALLAGASLVIYQTENLNRWMTSVSRNLSFGEEILNLVLWSLLLQKRNYDYQFLIVSAGIGIQVTGEVIAHTLRLYTGRAAMWVPNSLLFIAEILCLSIWAWAFLDRRRTEPGQPHNAHSILSA